MKSLGIVTARGGSKGIPRKNIRPLGGKPLIQYTAEAALASRYLDSTILSTEDEEIAEIGRACGLEVPFLRPRHLASDSAKSIDVLIHAVETLEEQGRAHEAICLLQPTNPFRTTELIDRCIQESLSSGADSVFTVLRVPAEHHPEWAYTTTEAGDLALFSGEQEPPSQRQKLTPAYHREGAVYVIRRNCLLENRSLYGSRVRGVEVDSSCSVNLDTMDDWHRAEEIIKGRATKTSSDG